jgi:hypothetical protein
MGSVTKRGNTWAYIVDLDRDPVTGKRRQKWVGGFGSREEAERAFDAAVEANAGNIGSDGSYRLWEAPSHSTLSRRGQSSGGVPPAGATLLGSPPARLCGARFDRRGVCRQPTARRAVAAG